MCEILFLSREHKVHIFKLTCNVPIIIIDILITEFLTVFLGFLTTFRRFPKILQNCFNPDERSQTLSKNFRNFPKIAEDC